MRELQTIEIDFDVYKLIEAERRSFNEPRILALRRLLNLPESPNAAASAHNNSATGRAWSGEGVTLPHGTKLRMRYNGRHHEGTILDGKWVVEGKSFESPSGAASGVALTKRQTPTRLDGWGYWEIQTPFDLNWVKIATLRPAVTVSCSKTVEELGL